MEPCVGCVTDVVTIKRFCLLFITFICQNNSFMGDVMIQLLHQTCQNYRVPTRSSQEWLKSTLITSDAA